MLTVLPSKTDGSLGRVKSDDPRKPATNLTTDVPASELEAIKTGLVDVCTETGTHLAEPYEVSPRGLNLRVKDLESLLTTWSRAEATETLGEISGIDHFTRVGDGLVGFGPTVTGTGAITEVASNHVDRVGVADLSTGASATGTASMCSALSTMFLGAGAWKFRADFRIPTASTPTERFSFSSGFMEGALGGNNYCGFLYSDASGFQAITAAASVFTVTSLAAAGNLADGNWHSLEMDVNSLGTQVRFYVDGVLRQTHTTNIPTISLAMVAGAIYKSVGTGARSVQLDLCGWSFQPTTPY